MQNYIAGALISVLVNAGICIAFIGQYGLVAAAAGAVVSRLVYLGFVVHHCRRQLGRQVLRVHHFGDSMLLFLAAFGVWYLTFAAIENAWIACAVAVFLTLPLIAGYIFYLRSQPVMRPQA
jgi:hypothetical protein